MPKLIVPNESANSQTEPLSIQGTAQAISSGAEIGRVQQTQGASAIASAAPLGQLQSNLGTTMAAQGIQYVNQGMKAMKDTMYNLVLSNASEDLNTRSAARVGGATKSSVDPVENYKKANIYKDPAALSKDLDTVSKEVVGEYGKALTDPAYKEKFTNSMRTLNEGHKAAAMGAQRQSQEQVATTALDQVLQTNIQNGLIDQPENIGYYAAQSLDRIQAALETGVIDPSKAAELGENVRKGLYYGSLQVANQKNPAQIEQLLRTSKPEDLNLNPVEYDQLAKQNKLAMSDANTLNKIQYQSQNEIEASKSAFLVSETTAKINKGQATAVEVQNLYDTGKIDYKQYTQLQSKFLDGQSRTEKTWNSRAEISANLQSGGDLASYSPAQIDDHYNNRVKSLSKSGTGADVSLLDKANLAAMYKAPVPSFNRAILYGLESGDPESIKQSVMAYNQVNALSPLAVSEIKKDKKASAYLSTLSNMYQYTTSMTPENIQKAHDSIYNVDGRTTKARINNYAEESAFSDKNIKSTIANNIEGGDPWYRGSDYVNNDVTQLYQQLYADAYRMTGNADSAIKMAHDQTKGLVGHSEVNNVPKFGLDAGTVMILPPEAVYSQYSPQQIRGAVNTEITPILPKGLNPNQVYLGSDTLTIEQQRRGQKPSYYLYYNDPNGHEVFLTDPATGQPKRWAADQQTDKAVKAGNQALQTGQPVPTAPTGTPLATADAKPKRPILTATEKVLSQTKGFGTNPLLSSEFINKMGDTALVRQISSHYPGAPETRSVVQGAITKMVGADPQPERVAQSLQVVNSVLTNNASPETFAKLGKVTTSPRPGDIVVTGNKAGLFAGYANVGGKAQTKMTYLQGTQLVTVNVPANEVKGYRSLPTPEQAAAQAKPYLTDANRFNPYTGERARVGTGQEQLNIYDMTSSLKADNVREQQNVINPATGQMVDLKATFNDKLKAVTGGAVAPEPSTKKSARAANAVANRGTTAQSTGAKTVWQAATTKQPNEIKLEMQNGELMHPLYNPATGKYTTSADEAVNIVNTLRQAPAGSAPKEIKELVNDYINNLYKSNEKRRKFTKDELLLLKKWYNEHLSADDRASLDGENT